MKNRILILTLSVITLFACTSDTLITDDNNLFKNDNNLTQRKAVERPFKIKKVTGTWYNFLGDGVSCSAVVLNAVGEGTVTHLGHSTLFEEWCFNGNGNDLGTRTLTITAANGDELWGNHTFIQWNSDFTAFEEVLVFDGGTGRFENASGEFNESVEVTYDDPNNPFYGTFTLSGEGTLKY
jgi:hypothetical protein